MAGYKGYSMSNNAVAAYEDGEKPLSKWTKREIIRELYEFAESEGINVPDFEKLTLSELRENFLEKSSWHHTSSHYNETDFYRIDEKSVKNAEEIVMLLESRVSKVKRTDKEKTEKEKNPINLAEARKIYARLNVIYASGMFDLKTINGLYRRWSSGRLNIKEAYAMACRIIEEKDREKVDSWRRLPKEHWRQKDVALYDNQIEIYILEKYSNNALKSNCKMVQEIKKDIMNGIKSNDTLYLTGNSRKLNEEMER